MFAAACTSSDQTADGTTTTEADSTNTTIDAMADVVDVCRSEMLKAEPDIVRLAIDPAITGFALNLPPEAVPETAAGLHECLGDEFAPAYLAADTIIAGQPLPPEVAECFEPAVVENGVELIEVSLRRARLEVPENEPGQAFVDLLADCVPGRFLASPLLAENEVSYLFSVDQECLDQAHQRDSAPLRAFLEIQVFADGAPDPSAWTDEEASQFVEPLYECVDTGGYIATDPSIGITLSSPTRSCIGEVAVEEGYWETKVALREFDQDRYEESINECLTPEEAFHVLGIPIPTDDPEDSNFAAVADCFTSLSPADLPESLADVATADDLDDAVAAAAEADDPSDAIVTLAAALTECAGPEGVAGSYAGTNFGTPIPEGTYDCLLPLAQEDAGAMLEGQLLIEAGLSTTPDGGAAFARAFSRCIPAGYHALPLFSDFNSPAMAETISRQCISDALPDGSAAADAYWAEFLARPEGGGEPSERTVLAVADMYACVDPGGGFAAVANRAGAGLSDDSVACINETVFALQPLERALIGSPLPEGALNQVIADCLTEEEVQRLQGG